MFGLFNRKVVGEAQPKSQGAVAAGTDWQSILTKADAGHVRYNEAVAALNVKVICDLSSLVRDRWNMRVSGARRSLWHCPFGTSDIEPLPSNNSRNIPRPFGKALGASRCGMAGSRLKVRERPEWPALAHPGEGRGECIR
jgi:hypothetical protein